MSKLTQTTLILNFFLFLVLGAWGQVMAGPLPFYTEGWNVSGDLAGWGPNTTLTTVNVSDSGGNPDGYLYSSGNVSGSFDIGAYSMLSNLTGDYGTSGGVWLASFDLLHINGNFDDAWLRFRYQDTSHNGWIHSIGTGFTTGGWISYNILFDQSWTDAEAIAAGWIQQDVAPDWSTTMSNVLSIEVRLSGEGFLAAGIDNFQLQSNPVPVPSTIILLSSGLSGLAWFRRKRKKS